MKGDASSPQGGVGLANGNRRLVLGALVVVAVVAAVLVVRIAPPRLSDTPGSNARDFVSGAYPKLVVEVDWVDEGGTSYKPPPAVLAFLEQRIGERATKPGGVSVTFGNAIATTKSSFSADDLRALEGTHRSARTGGDTAAIWIVFANRYSEGGAGGSTVIGVAYAGSSAAVFVAPIQDAATFLVPAETIERIAAVHEVGHLFGLVNTGTPMVAPHEDAAHPGHSSNPDSVMYWQAEGTDLVSLIAGGRNPDNFDTADSADLRAIGGK